MGCKGLSKSGYYERQWNMIPTFEDKFIVNVKYQIIQRIVEEVRGILNEVLIYRKRICYHDRKRISRSSASSTSLLFLTIVNFNPSDVWKN